jgi:hypothetical protein
MIATSEKYQLREKLLDACIAKQLLLIDNFKKRIEALTEPEGLGNEELYDSTDQSSNSQKVIEINTLNELLEFAKAELELLEIIKNTQQMERDRPSLGAVIDTNRGTFFISTSLEQCAVGGSTFIGISTKSPLYSAMEGKKKGDSFYYKGTQYKIKDIY